MFEPFIFSYLFLREGWDNPDEGLYLRGQSYVFIACAFLYPLAFLYLRNC